MNKGTLGTELTEGDLLEAMRLLEMDDMPPPRCEHFWIERVGRGWTGWLRENFPGCIEPCEH